MSSFYNQDYYDDSEGSDEFQDRYTPIFEGSKAGFSHSMPDNDCLLDIPIDVCDVLYKNWADGYVNLTIQKHGIEQGISTLKRMINAPLTPRHEERDTKLMQLINRALDRHTKNWLESK